MNNKILEIVYDVETCSEKYKQHIRVAKYGDRSNIDILNIDGFSIKNNPHSDMSFIYKNNLITYK